MYIYQICFLRLRSWATPFSDDNFFVRAQQRQNAPYYYYSKAKRKRHTKFLQLLSALSSNVRIKFIKVEILSYDTQNDNFFILSCWGVFAQHPSRFLQDWEDRLQSSNDNFLFFFCLGYFARHFTIHCKCPAPAVLYPIQGFIGFVK